MTARVGPAAPAAPAWAEELAARLPAGSEQAYWVRAPGRVNLIGEHTDYNQGFVLPAAIDLEIRAVFSPRQDRTVAVTSLSLDSSDEFELGNEGPPVRGRWSNYVRGVSRELLNAGAPIGRGLNAVIDSTLPVGAGLSSSAALEAIAALALLGANGIEPEPLRLATTCRQAENDYVGVACGVMDQMAVLLSREGHATLIDCRDLTTTHVAIPRDISIVVCDTRIERRLDASEYNRRRSECERGVQLLGMRLEGVVALRDVGPADLLQFGAELPPAVASRCRHVVEENARVHAAVKSLESGAYRDLGRLFADSHRSLRDLYEVSCPELNAMVEAAQKIEGCYGARLTGAGFGGCTVNLVERGAEAKFARAVAADYRRSTGLDARIFVCASASAASAGELT